MVHLSFGYANRTYTAPTYLLKVDLATFTLADTLTVFGANYIKAMAIDRSGTTPFLYLGSAQSPANVVKVDMTTFKENATVVALPGENSFQTVEIDTTLGMLYFGTYTSPVKSCYNVIDEIRNCPASDLMRFLPTSLIHPKQGPNCTLLNLSPGESGLSLRAQCEQLFVVLQ